MSPCTHRLAVRCSALERGVLRLCVSDAGPGIPDADRARVFEKYERLDKATSGAGLGLPIARAAIEAQHGQLHADSSPLGGASFIIEIPQTRRLQSP